MLMRWLHENARINFYHVVLIVKEVELRLCDDVTSNTYPSSSRCCWLSILFCKSFFEVCIYWEWTRATKKLFTNQTHYLNLKQRTIKVQRNHTLGRDQNVFIQQFSWSSKFLATGYNSSSWKFPPSTPRKASLLVDVLNGGRSAFLHC